MNNNQMNFDPMTGQPINQNINMNPAPNQQMQVPNVQTIPNAQQTEVVNTQNNAMINTQQQMQSIPTVEQSKQAFIDNTQANNAAKQEEKKEGPNIAFIVILFVIIFASIFFLFPYLIKVL